jgi:gliding motility-associated-like protein
MIKQYISMFFNLLKLNLKQVLIPLSILAFLTHEKANAQCNPRQDSLVLAELYDSTNGSRWLNTIRDTAKWKVRGVPIGKWYGVSIDTAGCVTWLFLNSNSLKGSLPASLNTLTALKWLNLSDNNISGQIPNFTLSNLEKIWLYDNKLGGEIPNFKLPNLTHLWLDYNNLTGQIPNFNLPKLEKLWVHDNLLNGSIPDFNSTNFPKLLELKFSSNQLTGSIPNFDLQKLTDLKLGYNELEGTIPIFDLPNLEDLWLNNNNLSGQIPKLYLPKLTALELYNNKLTGCIPRELKTNCPLLGVIGGGLQGNDGLTTRNWINYWRSFEGACPPTDTTACAYRDSLQLIALYDSTGGANWTNKWKLRESMSTWYGIKQSTEGCVTDIKLDSNNLRGALPELNFSKLRTISFIFNQLRGKLPNFKLPALVKLKLSRNQLDSIIPNFTGMTILEELDLDYNKLKGTIPNFDKLKNLLYLDLTSNTLVGSIPNFTNLPKLELLYLRINELTGAVPDFNLPKLTTLRLHNNFLISPLPNLLALTKLTDIQMQDNKLTGCFPLSYRRFCESITDPVKCNFDNNDGLGSPLQNSLGKFSTFCQTPKDTLLRKKFIYIGDTVHLDNIRIVYPKTDTAYVDTLVLSYPDCRIRIKITNITVKKRDTLSTTNRIIVTPNGDNINEQLDLQELVDWSLYPNSELTIYNRWGQKLYFASPYKQDWKGQNSEGKDLPNGDYFFILNLKPKGRTIKGSVYLAR